MDFSSLRETVSNLTLYDIKAGVRKVQNAVMNYTEMEAKVREATNNEPWGASSTLMQDIANGTFNFQQLNEIMPMIYKRFTEKSAEEWRQIYKALQLLEFLIRHGSERVIDDARSHLSLLKMLRQFHYIDQNGKDQGVNVRNRSKELVELLSDVEKIRTERKKARATRNKYGGYEGGGMGLGGTGDSSRYGGFGSDSGGYGGYSGGVYGDGGGFGGQSSDFQDTQIRRERFEEYDEYDEGPAVPSSKRNDPSSPLPARKTEPPKPKEPEADLFSFDDPVPAPSTSNGKSAATASSAGDDDDFDDFQSATPAASSNAASQPAATAFSIPPPASTSTTTSATQFAAPQPRSGAQGQNISDLFASISPPPRTNTASSTSAATPPISSPPAPTSTTQSAFKPPQPSGYQPNQPNYFQSVQATAAQMQSQSGTSTPISTSMATLGKPVSNPLGGGSGAKKSTGGDVFADLLGGSATAKKSAAQTKAVSLADMQRQKASAGIWGSGEASGAMGTTTVPQQQQQAGGTQQSLGGGLDDLLG